MPKNITTFTEGIQALPVWSTDAPAPNRGKGYVMVPTHEVAEIIQDHGFTPTSLSLVKTRQPDKQAFARHLVRFRQDDPDFADTDNGIVPEIILNTSHDGHNKLKFYAGYFRFVCSNGVIVGQGASMAFTHSGTDKDTILEALGSVMGLFEGMREDMDAWRRKMLSDSDVKMFGVRAQHIACPETFYDTMRQRQRPLDFNDFVASRRDADAENNLWNVFNRAQEATIKGVPNYRGARAVKRVLNTNLSLYALAKEAYLW